MHINDLRPSLINILMAPAFSLMYAGSGTISIIRKLTDFKRFRCHKNVTIISIKTILNCPHPHTIM